MILSLCRLNLLTPANMWYTLLTLEKKWKQVVNVNALNKLVLLA